MAQIKSYTSLEQSKILARILPLDTADMSWQYQKDRWVGEPEYREWPEFEKVTDRRDIPCWSLPALFGVLPNYTLINNGVSGKVALWCQDNAIERDNPVDACVEMLEKLHEQNLI